MITKCDAALFRCPQRRCSTDELEELWCVEYIGKSGTAKFGQSYLTDATRRQFGKFEQLDSDLLWLAQIIVNSLQLDCI